MSLLPSIKVEFSCTRDYRIILFVPQPKLSFFFTQKSFAQVVPRRTFISRAFCKLQTERDRRRTMQEEENVAFNPLLIWLSTEERKALIEKLCSGPFSLAVPQASSLDSVMIDVNFAGTIRPSVLTRRS